MEQEQLSQVSRLIKDGWHNGRRVLAQDGLALGLLLLATLVMNMPLPLHLGTSLASGRRFDNWIALWDTWWLPHSLSEGRWPDFFPYLFYPRGADMTFNPHRWTILVSWLPLSLLMSRVAAFNVVILLGLWLSGITTYYFLRYFGFDRTVAWFGGAYYACAPVHLAFASDQVQIGNLQWLPAFMLAFVWAMRKRGAGPAVLAAGALALNGYLNLHCMAFAAFLGGGWLILTAIVEGWWREASFWKTLGVFVLAALALTAPVWLPYLLALDRLQAAADSGYAPTSGVDVAAYLLPGPERPPFVTPLVAPLLGRKVSYFMMQGSFYLGWVSIGLVGLGVAGIRREPKRAVWLAMVAVFMLLSLGSLLQIYERDFPNVWTPYRAVEDFVLLRSLRKPYRFALIQILAWVMLMAYGLRTLQAWMVARRWPVRPLMVALGVVMLFELSLVPLHLEPADAPDFYRELGADPSAGAIIDLPMSDRVSRKYMYYQTIHHRPIVGGMISRMPPGAHDYINSNPLLRAWNQEQLFECGEHDMRAAVEALEADGFRYVVVHYYLWDSKPPVIDPNLTAYFETLEPVYADDRIVAYELADLADAPPPCLP
jgi:hypothetical protein